MLVLSRSDIKQLVPMADAIELMKVAFAELSAGRTISPLRTVIPVPEHNGAALFMPASVPAADALGLKIVSTYRDNPARGLPAIHAIVCLVDTATGRPSAIMDGTYMTALRTGAVSGAATDLLARPDSRTLVVIGTAAQAVTQAAAVCAVRPIERVIVVGRSEAGIERLREGIARDWPDLLGRIEGTLDPAAVAEADVICAATNSRTPVFDDALVRPGTHVNAVGAYTHEMQEVPAGLVQRATVVVDAVDAVLAEGGDVTIPLAQGLFGRDHVSRELGMVASGTAPGRVSDDEVTFFKSVGNAVQDVVVAKRAVERAADLGLGTEIDLG